MTVKCGLKALAMSLATAITMAGAAHADVIQIGDDGEVAIYAGPAVITDTGATPIVQATGRVHASSTEVRTAIAKAAAHYDLDPNLLDAVAWQESRFRHDAVSSAGAVGVMQLMPGTARDLRVDPSDLTQNVFGGAAYLGQMLRRYGGDVRLSLAAYNAGPGAVDRYRGVPPFAETQGYVKAIMGRLSPRP